MAPTIVNSDLQALYAYWDGKRGDRFAPMRAEIDPTEIPHLLPIMAISQVLESPRRYVFRLVGTRLQAMLGRDLTGRWLDEVAYPDALEAARREFDYVVDAGEPLCSFWRGPWLGREHWSFERLLLPLSEDGRHVDRVITGLTPD